MKLAASLAVTLMTMQLQGCSEPEVGIEEVAKNDRLWTGVAVSSSNRLFVNFPRWSDDVPISVAEIDENGAAVAYPNTEMNSWQKGEDPTGKFVCVQSVYVDDIGRLWVLDPAEVWPDGIVPGGARLFEFDLATDTVARTIVFDDTVVTQTTYLNDVRVDTETNTAFITDSGNGAIIVVDLDNNDARRLLDDHLSTDPEDIGVTVDGVPFDQPVASDGIALDTDGGWLYYQALTGRTLYRVPTAALRDSKMTDDELAAVVERVAESGVSDGLLFTENGIYVSALESNSIRLVEEKHVVSTVIADPRILWPDSFARAPDGSILFTTSQIHLENPTEPYRIFRITAD